VEVSARGETKIEEILIESYIECMRVVLTHYIITISEKQTEAITVHGDCDENTNHRISPRQFSTVGQVASAKNSVRLIVKIGIELEYGF
jgi:hypothetical protein